MTRKEAQEALDELRLKKNLTCEERAKLKKALEVLANNWRTPS